MGIDNVPFGNSIFQIKNFTDGRETPQRRYRHCLLQLRKKEQAMKECYFRRRRFEIDLEGIEEKLISTQGYEKKRLEIDLEEKKYQLDSEINLIEDCVVEIATYRDLLKDLPEYTREEFEEAEQGYWEKRFIATARRELTSTGYISTQTIEALENVGIIVKKDKDNKLIYERRVQNDILHISEADSIRDKTNNPKINAS